MSSIPIPSVQVPPEENFAGQVVAGTYRVDTCVGEGGMGTIWSGQHLQLGTRVAIKFIRADLALRDDARQRFEIEARAAANVQSPHAVKVYDYGVTDYGRPFIVMEFLEGEALADALIRRGPFPLEEVAHVISQAAEALEKAHQAGVVHRDLKPDNIFLCTNPEASPAEYPYTVKLVDFGIAKFIDAGRGIPSGHFSGPTQAGTVVGTPNFMSPEQLTEGGTPNALTDLWSLGACAFTAAVGQIPFEGDVLGDLVLKVCVAPLPVPSHFQPGIPPAFDAWFARACHREAKKRYQSARALADALSDATGQQNVVFVKSDDHVARALPSQATVPSFNVQSLPPQGGLSPKMALLAGLVIGVTIMVGAVGIFALRQTLADEEAIRSLPALDSGASKAALSAIPDAGSPPPAKAKGNSRH